MNHNALISIIVPVYGTEKYLTNCIESIRKQTYTNIELILVDDQSPDSCPKICDEYQKKDNRIAVIHQKNTGVSGARNSGMRQANGEFIMFVDSDDALFPDSVDNLLNLADAYNADIVSASYRKVNGDVGSIVPCVNHCVDVYTDDTPLLSSLRGDPRTSAVWAKLFRTDFIRGLAFEEGKDINEDGFFMFQCFIKRPIFVSSDAEVYLYFIRENSCSRQIFSDKYLSMIYFCDRKKEILESKFPQYLNEVQNMEVRVRIYLLDCLCNTTDRKYKITEKECVGVIRKNFKYHIPINNHHKLLAQIARMGLYPIYKIAVRLKYYR